jgi:hypothetical protein
MIELEETEGFRARVAEAASEYKSAILEKVARERKAAEAAHWQDVRERAAIAVMAALVRVDMARLSGVNYDFLAMNAVSATDALVAALKGEKP